jgi:hypothetical protein
MFLVDSHCHLDGLDYQSLHTDVNDALESRGPRREILPRRGDDTAGLPQYARPGGRA